MWVDNMETTKGRKPEQALTASHHERLIGELRADPDLAMAYLDAAAEDGDALVWLTALGAVIQVAGAARIARAVGMSRSSLERALSPRGNPRFSTVHAILRAAGLKLAVQPAESRR